MRAFLTAYARTVGGLGLALLVASLTMDTRWLAQPWGIVAMLATIIFLRAQQIPLTKYGALNLLALPIVSGALILGAPAASLAIYIGIFFTDIAFLRRSVTIAWINAGREVIALVSAFGAYAWASVSMAAGGTGFTAETLPALALFVFSYFVTSRLLLYFTLLIRDKLVDEEKSLILRYEVIAFGAGTIGVAIVLVAVTSLKPIGWGVVGVVLGLSGLLLKRILEESIAAEELNKILAMEQVVSSDVDIADAFRRIQELAHRLVDWQSFRIGRLEDGELHHVWQGDLGYLDPPVTPDAQLAALRRECLEVGDIILVADTQRDPRVLAGRSLARSVVVIPLRFGERTVGILELEHHKPDAYTAKEVALIRRFANQLATTLHIYDLRRPLLEAMNRVSRQLDTLTDSARTLRGGGESVART
ncbi:MAG TPA: GAF domain-containing protein, partial [Gemmatimonadaceae bacterium]|nr:GAF domain-containing protein [Gemmatimonadaceae bacterium]